MNLDDFLLEYEDALRIMELGFNYPGFAHYEKHGDVLIIRHSCKFEQDNSADNLQVPTFEQAFAYIALEHKFEGNPHCMDDGSFTYDLNDYPYAGRFYSTTKPDSYETAKEAKTACLRDLFKLIEDKKLWR